MPEAHDIVLKSKVLTIDLCDMFIGNAISYGVARSVYHHALDSSLVVKIEDKAMSFQNAKEWGTWNDIKDSPLSKWFTPCVAISPGGSILIQKKAEYLPKEKFPKKIPAFFGDLKYSNFGTYNGYFVCLDYGTLNTAMWHAVDTKKMQKAEFWESRVIER